MSTLQRGDEDGARRLLLRATVNRAQRGRLDQNIADIRTQVRSLKDLTARLMARIESFRLQKKAAKAQYVASTATVKAGETIR